jgi:TonB family protein
MGMLVCYSALMRAITRQSSLMRVVTSFIFGALFLAGCASKPTYRYYSEYRVNGGPKEVSGAAAAEAHKNAANAILEQRTSGRFDNPIRVLSSPQPVTPPAATDDRIEGEVKVQILFGESGTVEDVQVLESPHALLTDAVLEAVRRWRITPATVSGKPAKITVRQTFAFKAGW